ncbi:LysM peptidoglycan-binding domain-containing protein [Cohnella pontilimi]|uniref:LysM peptidoglycan-binding domain-containing protein n=1 Tax=Cohnella pontilimi TaxID=2564100 RepID=A0A4U0F9K9_9BACL|nr:LysM peptidoglycan-binding domain-containing protein [Cohnella pontilimi]TJY41453.1 LysM peptidoglycan-binding domain-containing protein [Cohnella pontilimi]
MTDPLRGLRFDIYERVHLPEDVAAIGELEEIELVPHMKVLPQEDQVLLRGHLLLSGVYRPLNDADSASQLEHWIPVEISLPMNRVDKVEDLAIEIDNFDVDVLSSRSLNVTGVLALRGVQAAASHAPVWRDDSFTVVHEAPFIPEAPDADEQQETVPFARQAVPKPPASSDEGGTALPDEARSSEPPPALEDTPPFESPDPASEAGVWRIEEQEPDIGMQDEAETQIRVEAEAEQQPAYDLEQWIRDQDSQAQSDEAEEWLNPEAYEWKGANEPSEWEDESSSRPPEPEIPIPGAYSTVPDEKPEMKVAFGVKSPQPSASSVTTGVGLLSQLGEKGAAREAELRAMLSAQAESSVPDADEKLSKESTGDELEWTRLFLSDGADAQSFRKMRLCIVQKDDTLETIAARYHVQTRELQRHNRLSDPYLSAGQVLYIPS